VKVTISTDDPISFGNRINDEYAALGEKGGFSRRELVQIASNGFDVALMPEAQKRPWLEQLDAVSPG
jgi:adenosine deaminase